MRALQLVFFILFFQSVASATEQRIESSLKMSPLSKVLDRMGMNYFSFWEGPSLEDGQTGRNELSNPQDSGLSLFNLVSITYRMDNGYNFDLQNRVELIHTQEQEWRFQGIRAGVSGELFKTKSLVMKGAINTDVPELNGRDARARTVIFNPGLFASLNWNMSPRWSLYSILSPRIFFYRDDEAVEKEWTLAGRDPGEKPRAVIQASPTINYQVNDKLGFRSGIDLQFRQFVKSETGDLRRWPTSWSFGPTYSFHKSLNVYLFAQTWPFDGKKLTRETASLGMWLSGVVF